MNIPTIMNNNSFTTVTLNDSTELFFSYQTLIAFKENGNLYVSDNEWGNTTGKHINSIDGGSKEARKKRIPHCELLKKYRGFF